MVLIIRNGIYIEFKTNIKRILNLFAYKPKPNLMFITRTGRAYHSNFDYVRRPNYQLVASYMDMMETIGYPQ